MVSHPFEVNIIYEGKTILWLTNVHIIKPPNLLGTSSHFIKTLLNMLIWCSKLKRFFISHDSKDNINNSPHYKA